MVRMMARILQRGGYQSHSSHHPPNPWAIRGIIRVIRKSAQIRAHSRPFAQIRAD
jgi:hypothetical protein